MKTFPSASMSSWNHDHHSLVRICICPLIYVAEAGHWLTILHMTSHICSLITCEMCAQLSEWICGCCCVAMKNHLRVLAVYMPRHGTCCFFDFSKPEWVSTINFFRLTYQIRVLSCPFQTWIRHYPLFQNVQLNTILSCTLFSLSLVSLLPPVTPHLLLFYWTALSVFISRGGWGGHEETGRLSWREE